LHAKPTERRGQEGRGCTVATPSRRLLMKPGSSGSHGALASPFPVEPRHQASAPRKYCLLAQRSAAARWERRSRHFHRRPTLTVRAPKDVHKVVHIGGQTHGLRLTRPWRTGG